MVKYLNATNIEWTRGRNGEQGYTWNPVVGCRNGCSYCYAQALCKRFAKPWGRDPKDPFAPTFYPERLGAPSKLKRPSKIFVCSMGELWGPWVSKEWQFNIMAAIWWAPQHTFLNLTKNPDGLLKRESECPPDVEPWPPNLWLGVSVTGDDDGSRLHDLAQVNHPNKFVSFEPLLADIANMDDWRMGYNTDGIDWVIIGAQTGPKAVAPRLDWVKNLMFDCEWAGIPFFLKDNVPWNGARPQQFPIADSKGEDESNG